MNECEDVHYSTIFLFGKFSYIFVLKPHAQETEF